MITTIQKQPSPYVYPGCTQTDVLITCVCQLLDTTPEKIASRTRSQPEVYARQLIAYFLNLTARRVFKHTRITLKEIGGIINRDHATVIWGINNIENWIQYDPNVRKDVEKINLKIGIMKPLPTTPREAKQAIEIKYSLADMVHNSVVRNIYQDICQMESLDPDARLKKEMIQRLDSLFR